MRLSWYQLFSTEAHQWGCPMTEAHQWGCPITETHQWCCPITEDQWGCPITEAHQRGWPVTEVYQWGYAITEAHQWGCPILDVQPPKYFFSTSYASLGNSLQSWNSDRTNLDQSCPVTPLRSHSYEEVELRSITSSMDQSSTPFPNYHTLSKLRGCLKTRASQSQCGVLITRSSLLSIEDNFKVNLSFFMHDPTGQFRRWIKTIYGVTWELTERFFFFLHIRKYTVAFDFWLFIAYHWGKCLIILGSV